MYLSNTERKLLKKDEILKSAYVNGFVIFLTTTLMSLVLIAFNHLSNLFWYSSAFPLHDSVKTNKLEWTLMRFINSRNWIKQSYHWLKCFGKNIFICRSHLYKNIFSYRDYENVAMGRNTLPGTKWISKSGILNIKHWILKNWWVFFLFVLLLYQEVSSKCYCMSV